MSGYTSHARAMSDKVAASTVSRDTIVEEDMVVADGNTTEYRQMASVPCISCHVPQTVAAIKMLAS